MHPARTSTEHEAGCARTTSMCRCSPAMRCVPPPWLAVLARCVPPWDVRAWGAPVPALESRRALGMPGAAQGARMHTLSGARKGGWGEHRGRARAHIGRGACAGQGSMRGTGVGSSGVGGSYPTPQRQQARGLSLEGQVRHMAWPIGPPQKETARDGASTAAGQPWNTHWHARRGPRRPP